MYLHYSIDIADAWECDIKYYKYSSYEWEFKEVYLSTPYSELVAVTCFGKDANTIMVF
jgi:hypothetical protein